MQSPWERSPCEGLVGSNPTVSATSLCIETHNNGKHDSSGLDNFTVLVIPGPTMTLLSSQKASLNPARPSASMV